MSETKLRKLFRGLVWFEILLALASITFMALVEDRLLGPALIRAREQAYGSPDDLVAGLTAIVALLLALGLIVAIIGLLRFWNPARHLYVLSHAGLALLLSTSSPTVVSGIGDFLEHLAGAITGMVIAVMYFSPVADLFQGKTLAGGSGSGDHLSPYPRPQSGGHGSSG